jgi:GNAT superfamily N-acetyltransferase
MNAQVLRIEMNDDFVHTFRAADGTLLKVRPLTPGDAQELVELFEHMGPESRFLRFNLALSNPSPDLVWSEAKRMAQIDPEKDGAWLVLADLPGEENAPVAGCRFIRLDDESAEASLAVRDDMQRKGIGRQLLAFLAQQARQKGIRRLVATVQRGNRPLWHLLQSSGMKYEMESEGGFANIAVDLLQPQVD